MTYPSAIAAVKHNLSPEVAEAIEAQATTLRDALIDLHVSSLLMQSLLVGSKALNHDLIKMDIARAGAAIARN